MELSTCICKHLKPIFEKYKAIVNQLEIDKQQQLKDDATFEKFIQSFQTDGDLSFNYTVQLRAFHVTCLLCRPGRVLLNPYNYMLETGKISNLQI